MQVNFMEDWIMLPMDFRHYHIPLWRWLMLRLEDANRWLEKPAVMYLSRGEVIAAVVGLAGLAYFIK